MDRRTVLLILTFAGVIGCTRSEPVPETPAPQPQIPSAPSAVSDNRPTIVAFGDSLSEGFGAEPGRSFPDFLQRELDQAGYVYRVVNLGISGDTTTGGLGRIDSAIELKPDLVILELGGNDGLRGVPVAATKSNLEQMIARLQSAGIRVVLAGMSLPPNYGKQYVNAFERMYSDLAAQYKLTLIPFLLEDIEKQYARNPGLIQRDGIHPTAQGNEIVAKTVFRYLKPLLRRG